MPMAVLSEGVTLSGMLAMKDSRLVTAELDEQAIAEHERVVTLYRDTYLEQESLHAPLFDRE